MTYIVTVRCPDCGTDSETEYYSDLPDALSVEQHNPLVDFFCDTCDDSREGRLVSVLADAVGDTLR